MKSSFISEASGIKTWGEIMGFKRSANQFVNTNEASTGCTTSLFVQNHTSPQHLLQQVEALVSRGEIHQASYLIDCIIDNNNALVSSADLFVLHAKIYIEQFGFSVHAQCAIQQALLLEPNHGDALRLQTLSNLHEEFRDGLYTQAQESVREFLKTNPDNVYATYLLAYNMFWKNGAESEAVELLEKCVKARPSFLRAWLCVAMAYKKNQNFEKAEDAFQECLGLDKNPSNSDFYKNHLQSI
jgi:tetratricopeptide (TPR) repeat protein